MVLSTKKCRKCNQQVHFRACSPKCAAATCQLAEIDILAYKDDEVHVFEVKCSYRFVKAKKQLTRILRLLRLERPAKAYFYCGSADRLECIAKAEY